MNYVGNVIRPPSEAESIILQVTVGCSYNKCTFCGAYKDTDFKIKPEAIVESDLEFAQKYSRNQNRLFLADGDVLILSQNRLLALLQKIRRYLPWIKRVSLYGNAKAIRSKSVEQLRELKSLGLDRVYMGLESGCDDVLSLINKGETAETMVAAAQKIKGCGIFLSVTVLLGLGGVEMSRRHAIQTAETLNRMAPRQIAALTLMPLENTELGMRVLAGDFVLPEPQEILLELKYLVRHLQNIRCQFHANHASSYLPLAGRLPRDQKLLLSTIDKAIDGAVPMVPESRRAL